MRVLVLAGIACLFFSFPVAAQETYSSGQMWGTQPSGVAVPGAAESAISHVQNGITAGQVNAAAAGMLFATGSAGALTIQSIGSQSIVTSTINGNDIDSSVSATQDSTNSGDVSNQGTINSN